LPSLVIFLSCRILSDLFSACSSYDNGFALASTRFVNDIRNGRIVIIVPEADLSTLGFLNYQN